MKKTKPDPPPAPLDETLTLSPSQQRIVNLVVAYASSDTYLEDCEKHRRAQEAMAAEEFEQAAKDWEAREAERKRLWGNKFPRVLGRKPDEPDKIHSPAIHPVKPAKKRGVRGNGKRATSP